MIFSHFLLYTLAAMARGAAATQPDDGDAQQGEPKGSKRRCVQSACVPCRKRKSKVSGHLRLVL